MDKTDTRKRKHNFITLNEKLKVLKQLEENDISIKEAANTFNVHHTTVRLWLKNYDKYKEWKSEHPEGITSTKKTMSTGGFPEIDKAVWHWYIEKRMDGEFIPASMIKEQALKVYSDIKNANKDKVTGIFTASSTWLKNWKARYGLLSSNSSEEVSAQVDEDNQVNALNDTSTTTQVSDCNPSGLNNKIIQKQKKKPIKTKSDNSPRVRTDHKKKESNPKKQKDLKEKLRMYFNCLQQYCIDNNCLTDVEEELNIIKEELQI